MVTIAPPRKDWSAAFQEIGKGASEGYQERSDQMAIQKAIEALPANHTPQQLLGALTKVRTYNPESRQQFLKNYLGVEEFTEGKRKTAEQETKTQEQLTEQKRHNLATENISLGTKTAKDVKDLEKKTEKEVKEAKKSEDEAKEVEALGKLVYPDLTPEERKAKTEGLKPADLRSLVAKPENVTDYEIAKNKSENLKPIEKEIAHTGEEAKKLLPVTDVAIMNNEKYGPTEKLVDQAIEASGSKFFRQFISTTGQLLSAYTPIAIANFSKKMGGVLSVKKIQILEQKAASPNKTKETNRLFLYMDLFDRKLDILRQKLTNKMISENKYGLIPSDLNERLDKAMKPFQKMMNRDIELMMDGKKPTSPMSDLATMESKRAKVPEGKTLVYDQEGKLGHLDSNLVGTKGYEDLKAYE